MPSIVFSCSQAGEIGVQEMTTMEIKGPTLKKEAELVKVLRGDNSSDQLSAQLNVG